MSVICVSDMMDKYGLKVNMSKTNVIVFRNGGILRQNEKNYYKGGQITCVTYYKYLGIMYSSRLCWTRANQTSASQADRTVFAIKSAMKGMWRNVRVISARFF